MDVVISREAGMARNKLIGLMVSLSLMGCTKQVASYTRSAGSVALSADGTQVYAVDSDNGTLLIASAADGKLINTVKVGANPARVVVGNDGRVFVSNRGDRTVSVVDVASLKETSKIATGVEPVGLSFTPDGSKLLIVSATDLNDPSQGTLTSVDVATLKTDWQAMVGEEPRGVTVVGDKAYVSNLKQGRLTVVNTSTHQVTKSVSLDNPDQLDETNPTAAQAGNAADVTASPDGKRVYVPHVWQVVGTVGGPSQAGPVGNSATYGGSVSACDPNPNAIVSAGLGTVETDGDTNRADTFNCTDGSASTATDFPPSRFNTPNALAQGPSVAVVDPSGTWVYVVNRESHTLSAMPTKSRLGSGIKAISVDNIGEGADGIALSKDGKTAFVYSQFDHKLQLITASGTGSNTRLEVSSEQKLAQDTLSSEQVQGRKAFFSARNPKMTQEVQGISCASCHLEGREDGHVWQFPDGPRQTPSLAGRHIDETAPYHWAGLFPTVEDFFKETVVGRMGGHLDLSLPEDKALAKSLKTFLVTSTEPENPLKGRVDLQPNIAAGRAAFVKANCETCHKEGSAFVDGLNHDVGTLSNKDLLEPIGSDGLMQPNQAFLPLQTVNTPSLLGLGRTAPYLHDGKLPTIGSRIAQARYAKGEKTDHGDTSKLSDEEIGNLEIYLKSL
jgi:YVTN family beta-propeller protein